MYNYLGIVIGIEKSMLIPMLVPLILLLASYVILSNIDIPSSITSRQDAETNRSIVICVYQHSCINNTIINLLLNNITKYYDNITLMIFSNISIMISNNLTDKCDILLGIDNLLLNVLRYAGIIKPKPPAPYYSLYKIPKSISTFIIGYGIPYAYYRIHLHQNLSVGLKYYIFSKLLGRPMKHFNISNYTTISITAYEMIAILNSKDRIDKIIDIILENVSRSVFLSHEVCRSIYDRDDRVHESINTLELLSILRRISKEVLEHFK